jgi:hypothetical protein
VTNELALVLPNVHTDIRSGRVRRPIPRSIASPDANYSGAAHPAEPGNSVQRSQRVGNSQSDRIAVGRPIDWDRERIARVAVNPWKIK